MEYRTKAQIQAEMAKWRDVDAVTIAEWVDRSRSRRSPGIDVFVAGCRKTRMHRRSAQFRRSQIEQDRLYTYNCA